MQPDNKSDCIVGGELGIRTLGTLLCTTFRVLWVNGSLAIFEGGFGRLRIRQKSLILKAFWAVAPLKFR